MLTSALSRITVYGARRSIPKIFSLRLSSEAVAKANSDDVSIMGSSGKGLEQESPKGIDGWEIMAGVCVTRHPVICPPMSPVEHTYYEHLNKLEIENSVLSDFELKIMEDKARKMLGEKEMEELGEGEINEQSALELLDMWKKESEEFEQAKSLEYEPTSSSLGVSPARQVVLVQKYKIGSGNFWLLPQGPWKPGETLRMTSERIVAETCDPSLGIRILGNAPVGFYKYKYPKKVRSQGYIGAKVFFYRGQVSMNMRSSLPLLLAKGRNEQLWLTQDQLKDKLQRSYGQAVSQFLIRDD